MNEFNTASLQKLVIKGPPVGEGRPILRSIGSTFRSLTVLSMSGISLASDAIRALQEFITSNIQIEVSDCTTPHVK